MSTRRLMNRPAVKPLGLQFDREALWLARISFMMTMEIGTSQGAEFLAAERRFSKDAIELTTRFLSGNKN
ncbi:hypothetical protein [Pseudomonas phage IR-QUMS-PaBa1-GHS-2021]|nr:hypothetical protein [Pseudomonas phage IR-QUMS-PaBa1-GHS-2021]